MDAFYPITSSDEVCPGTPVIWASIQLFLFDNAYYLIPLMAIRQLPMA